MKPPKDTPPEDQETPISEHPKECETQPLPTAALLQQQLTETREKYVRLLAESDNQRKRMQKERQESNKFAIAGLLRDFLQPLDYFEKALGLAANHSEEVKIWSQGFEMILAQFKELLSQHGVIPFSAVGEFFDPHRHEAIEMEETESEPPGKILEEFAKGYLCGDQLLRPAKVKVAKQPPERIEKQPPIPGEPS
ncbi:MAG: nucleotide exchange factor GrpE [Chlamydiota bacterium]|nr:nucleotide exchange factor GrpE [Chlamydiota bacterium]